MTGSSTGQDGTARASTARASTARASTARAQGPRRRASEDVEDAIIAATLELLDEVGFASLTVEAVAARAGAAKTAVYRRWPSKVPLVVDALVRSRPEWPIPDTGNLRSDLIALWKNLNPGSQRSVERILPLAASYLSADDDLAVLLRERYFEPRLRQVRELVKRAAARGEIRSDVDAQLAFDFLFGPLAYRRLRGLSPDEQTVGQFVDMALAGLRPRAD
jgi:AcrR family transcriptional regulator